MAHPPFNVRKVIPVLGIVVLVLGGLSLWLLIDGTPPPSRESPHRMAERQIREQRGDDWEIRYVEAGAGPVMCGYAAPRNRPGQAHEPVAFISRVGRVMFADDPLSAEFRDLRERFCPGFARIPLPAGQ